MHPMGTDVSFRPMPCMPYHILLCRRVVFQTTHRGYSTQKVRKDVCHTCRLQCLCPWLCPLHAYYRFLQSINRNKSCPPNFMVVNIARNRAYWSSPGISSTLKGPSMNIAGNTFWVHSTKAFSKRS